MRPEVKRAIPAEESLDWRHLYLLFVHFAPFPWRTSDGCKFVVKDALNMNLLEAPIWETTFLIKCHKPDHSSKSHEPPMSVFVGAYMGCFPLPGAPGVQWLEGDVYRNQRDPGEFRGEQSDFDNMVGSVWAATIKVSRFWSLGELGLKN